MQGGQFGYNRNMGTSPGSRKPSIAYGFSRVKRWTKKVDVFAKQYLLIPICENNHWTLAIVCHPHLVLEQMETSIQKAKEDKEA